jgi:hypothetical protein
MFSLMDLLNFLYEHIFWILSALGALVFMILYHRNAQRRWLSILSTALDYQRYHLNNIMGEKSIDEKTGEFARAMLWAINKQFVIDRKRGWGLYIIWKSIRGETTSIQILGEIVLRIAKNRMGADLRIMWILGTLISTFYRYFLIRSSLSLFFLILMDLSLLLSFFRTADNSASQMYRYIASGR